MSIPYKRALSIFKQLGAKDAKAWAEEETVEDHPVLVRFLFLKALWRSVIGDDDSWMHERGDPKHPIPAAIQRMLAKGIDPDDLTDVVRDMQIEVLFNACVSLNDSAHGIEDLQEKIPETVDWCLAEHDVVNGRAMRIASDDIHSDFYDFDPTGRHGEPRNRRAVKKRAAPATTKSPKRVSRR